MIDQNSVTRRWTKRWNCFYGFRASPPCPTKCWPNAVCNAHHRALYFVGRHPGLSVNALLGILGVSKRALNAPLRQLIERGLIAVEVG